MISLLLLGTAVSFTHFRMFFFTWYNLNATQSLAVQMNTYAHSLFNNIPLHLYLNLLTSLRPFFFFSVLSNVVSITSTQISSKSAAITHAHAGGIDNLDPWIVPTFSAMVVCSLVILILAALLGVSSCVKKPSGGQVTH